MRHTCPTTPLVRRGTIAALAMLLATLAAGAQDRPRRYWQDTWRGWHFYEEPDATDESAAPPSAPPTAPASQLPAAPAAKVPELVEFERLQKTLEELRNIAIMRPTEANVRRYMTLEAQVVERASRFADIAQRVAWSTPALDPTLQGRPVNAKALEVFEQSTQAERTRLVAELGRDHVLLFFFRSDCPYCHAFAPTLQAFGARHGIQVAAVSVDGGPLPGFPDARADNGIATALKVSQVPAVFLAQPAAGRIVPLGFGVLSESQLLERIATVTTPDTPWPNTAGRVGQPLIPAQEQP